MPFRHLIIEQLAADHEAHLRWLKGHCGGQRSDADLEDALQRAFVKAIANLDADPRPDRFVSYDKACAWFHTIAERVVFDEHRHDHGRRESERASRPQLVSMYTAEGPRPLATPGLTSKPKSSSGSTARGPTT